MGGDRKVEMGGGRFDVLGKFEVDDGNSVFGLSSKS